MKKKLALLLVLSMVLSMIPMNVFGAATDVYRYGEAARIPENAKGENQKAIIAVDAAFLANNFTTTVSVYVDINAYSWNGIRFDSLTIREQSDATLFTASAPVLVSSGGVVGNSRYQIDFEAVTTWDVAVAAKSRVTFDVVFDAGAWDGDVTVTATALHNAAMPSYYNPPKSDAVTIGTRFGASGLNVSYGDPVPFSDVASLGSITIAEKFIGQIPSGDLHLNFTINGDYLNWVAPSKTANYSVTNNTHIGGGVTWDTDSNAFKLVSSKVLSLTLPVTSIGRALGSFSVNNLKISADERAKFENVSINVSGYYYDSAGKQVSIHPDGLSYSFTLTVASLMDYMLQLTPYSDTTKSAALYDFYSGEYDVASARFTLTELTPNALPSTRTSNLQALFNAPEGIKFTGANVSLHKAGDEYANIIYKNQFVNAGDDETSEGVKLTSDYLRVNSYINREAFNNVKFELRVQLWVSIEPGFEGKYPDADGEIIVEFDGPAFENVKIVDKDKKSVAKQVKVGTVVDQVVVEVEEKTGIESANAGQYVNAIELSDILITETEPGMLEKNSEIWVYIESTRIFDLAFTSAAVTANTAESGLKVSKATRLSMTDLPDGIRFEILSESDSQKEPGVITISGGLVTGLVYPGRDYQVVVSGPALANSHIAVYADAKNQTIYTTNRSKEGPTLFENAYSAELFTYEGGTVQNPLNPPAGPTVDTVPAESTGLSMSVSTPFVDTANGRVYNPFIIPTDGPGANTGYVSAAVFADLIGGEVSWEAPYATITDGDIVVVLENEASTALVNDQEVGIYSGSAASVPALNFNDRVYLPARFVADMFGLDVDWNTTTGIVTFS